MSVAMGSGSQGIPRGGGFHQYPQGFHHNTQVLGGYRNRRHNCPLFDVFSTRTSHRRGWASQGSAVVGPAVRGRPGSALLLESLASLLGEAYFLECGRLLYSHDQIGSDSCQKWWQAPMVAPTHILTWR